MFFTSCACGACIEYFEKYTMAISRHFQISEKASFIISSHCWSLYLDLSHRVTISQIKLNALNCRVRLELKEIGGVSEIKVNPNWSLFGNFKMSEMSDVLDHHI